VRHPTLAQALGNTQRTIRVELRLSDENFSPRKLFPTAPRTLGDYLMGKRLEDEGFRQDLTCVEYNQLLPTQAEWQRLIRILLLADLPLH